MILKQFISTTKLISFLLDFPDTCPEFYGVHTVDCLKTLWGMVGCLPVGEEYPEILPPWEFDALTSTNYT